jgi:hypothetical protein
MIERDFESFLQLIRKGSLTRARSTVEKYNPA